jgi:hypothetical protein
MLLPGGGGGGGGAFLGGGAGGAVGPETEVQSSFFGDMIGPENFVPFVIVLKKQFNT